MSQISWLDIHTTTFTPEENARELLEKSLDPWVSEDTFAVKIFIKNNISHYFLRRDLLPEQELLEEQHGGVTLRCQAAHENQILPLLFYWLPDIQILEPSWLKEKLIRTLESYLAMESSAHNQVISIT